MELVLDFLLPRDKSPAPFTIHCFLSMVDKCRCHFAKSLETGSHRFFSELPSMIIQNTKTNNLQRFCYKRLLNKYSDTIFTSKHRSIVHTFSTVIFGAIIIPNEIFRRVPDPAASIQRLPSRRGKPGLHSAQSQRDLGPRGSARLLARRCHQRFGVLLIEEP